MAAHGGSAGIRTLDLRIKSPLLYQLSYRPDTLRGGTYGSASKGSIEETEGAKLCRHKKWPRFAADFEIATLELEKPWQFSADGHCEGQRTEKER